jgi:hypothetical protein
MPARRWWSWPSPRHFPILRPIFALHYQGIGTVIRSLDCTCAVAAVINGLAIISSGDIIVYSCEVPKKITVSIRAKLDQI